VNRTTRPQSSPGFRRRGVTLVEMLVTVAMLVIIMTILVQVFQGATGALSAAQTIQQLDDQLKLLDSTIRADLSNVTATFTPPLKPSLNLGYFEYGENDYADIQGEDSDDYIRFTAQAPPGRPFTGRMWVNSTGTAGMNNENASTSTSPCPQPVTITSEYAEIIYFLRNGNLYRRVLLVAPELQSSIVPAVGNVPYGALNLPGANSFSPQTSPFSGGQVLSWQGVNDLSARPAGTGPNSTNAGITLASQAAQGIILNTLGDLTNRENRAFYSRFSNDFLTVSSTNGFTAGPDGIADDVNGDNVPDYYPTLYPGIFPSTAGGIGKGPGNNGNQLIFEPNYNSFSRGFLLDGNSNPLAAGFPFVFPGAYSQAQSLSSGQQIGWIHSPAPYSYVPGSGGGCTGTQFDASPLAYLQSLNHNPLDLGDNLPTLTNAGPVTLPAKQPTTGEKTTWWGFPTWRETLSPAWTDPTIQINVGNNLATAATPTQPAGLVPLSTTEVSNGAVNNFTSTIPRALLPPMTSVSPTFWRNNPDLFSDGYGDNNGVSAFFTSIFGVPADQPTAASLLWTTLSWEDDLIMTNVRSFDVKAYDNALGGYGDLGWGDDLRLYVPFQTASTYIGPAPPPAVSTAPYLGSGSPIVAPLQVTIWPPVSSGGVPYSTVSQTFAHEGRMPPLVEDLRFDAQYGPGVYGLPSGNTYTGNIGDDNPGIVRLRRVWDTWSTEYTQAPATGVNAATGANNGFPVGPPFTPPIYPSYPAPYPAPLLGIQIQIRVADPTNQRIKSITIRQDFSEKL
jgi:prepilin-type N-terminal cleavage/methylation domain-containing protein